MKFYLFIFIILFSIKPIFAETLDLEKDELGYVGKSVVFIEDKDSSFTIDDIVKIKDSHFKKQNNDVFLSFFTSSTYWFKIKVLNKTDDNLKRYFINDTPWIDTFNIYIYDSNNKLTKYKLGTLLPFKERSMKINLINQVHDFSKGKSTIYIQIKTRDPFIIPLSIMSEKNLYKKLLNMSFVETATYSIVTAILLFNFLIFVIARYKPYFYYILYLLSYLIMSLSYDSHTFKYIFYEMPNIQNWMQSINIFFYLIFSLLFAKSFLDLKENLPKLNKITNYILYIHIMILILTTFIGYKYSILYVSCITPLFSIYMVFLALYAYIKGNKKAIFFVLATLFGCAGAFFTASVATSLIDYNWYLFKGVDIGIVIDSILFSIALAYKYTSLTKEIKKTRDELIDLNYNLEQKVIERTNSLDMELKNKTVLLKELSHRVKNNLQIISALLSMDKNKIKNEYDKELIEMNIKRIKSISILYENFLEIESGNNISLKEYFNKIIEEFTYSATSFKVQFDLEFDDLYFNQNNLIPIGLVLNELLLNSIKYAFVKSNNSKISISFLEKEGNNFLTYKDNGVGTNIQKLKEGFGFSLINTLVSHQLNGKIVCKNNKGLEYNIIFPCSY